MDILADTNVLLRRIQPHDRRYRVAHVATDQLGSDGHRLCITSQNLIELWTVCTRPTSANGMGFEPAVADEILQNVEDAMVRLPDMDEVYGEWRKLVVAHSVSGKPSHDAKLVAAMKVHRITHILTFDQSGFARYPGVTILDPLVVAGNVQPEK